MSRPIVLLTATVTPNAPALGGVVNDPRDRLIQYRRSIKVWSRAAQSQDFSLAVVETSGSTAQEVLGGVSGAARANIQFVPYLPPRELLVRGKGAAELGAVHEALGRLDGISDESTVYKVTGRLALLNPMILETLPADGLRLRMTLDRSFADSRVFGASLAVWRDQLQDHERVINDESGTFLEHFIAGRASYGSTVGRISLSRFRQRPVLSGRSGATGATYSAASSRVRAGLLTWTEAKLAALAARKQV